ncbi:Uncharacterised protein [Mycobacteroides abscessus subsp. abscessus]|uniref:hypothetical protein n=1 Tax=Mycobacteroides abscessus TaxID=36809 RepID=UPI000927F49B|nr:hypothetical protein [Mycobacteroides abscessus]SIJ20521.1 Uncharacterised protein [Mycobacteroides abscessus subsp. abscessus]SLH39727.1 Uncharacterised protein [Mycobacteroides abscessus subsp. abscessus]
MAVVAQLFVNYVLALAAVLGLVSVLLQIDTFSRPRVDVHAHHAAVVAIYLASIVLVMLAVASWFVDLPVPTWTPTAILCGAFGYKGTESVLRRRWERRTGSGARVAKVRGARRQSS